MRLTVHNIKPQTFYQVYLDGEDVSPELFTSKAAVQAFVNRTLNTSQRAVIKSRCQGVWSFAGLKEHDLRAILWQVFLDGAPAYALARKECDLEVQYESGPVIGASARTVSVYSRGRRLQTFRSNIVGFYRGESHVELAIKALREFDSKTLKTRRAFPRQTEAFQVARLGVGWRESLGGAHA